MRFPAKLPARRAGDAWRLLAGDRSLRLSHLDKVYWPDDGLTKRDLLAYYFNVAELLLPHLRDRPLTMRRMPDGLLGEPFYEKQVPSHAPDWLGTTVVPSGSQGRAVEYVMVQDLPSLLYVANLGCIEMHPFLARAGSLDRPDYALFDLDPFPPYEFADVTTVAKLVRVVLEGVGLRGYPKTSGATGMQVLVPLDGGATFAEVRAFVERVGRMVVRAYPARATMVWSVAERAGKVFIDHQMNRQGANIASAYSLRPLPGAPVSTPLDWEELDGDLEPGDFRIDNVWDRFAGGDRYAPVLTDRQALAPALDALGVEVPAEPERRRPRFASASPPPASAGGQLREYAGKRDFTVTPEPGETATAGRDPEAARPAGVAAAAPLEPGRRFTIQQHHARRLHHDVRFERDGVLVSFAVPKRLPEAPGVRHLAVNTEDHPLDYLTFSGTIPAGEYGGGEVRLFDLGTYEAVEVTDRKWTVRLHGSRYHGAEFHFVRTRERDWLCLLAGRTPIPQPEAPPLFEPMMAVPGWQPFDDDGWLFEVKWDGHRCLATLDRATRLTSRTGRDASPSFPELLDLHRQLVARNAVVDGEVVALDPQGRPSFQRMQDRFHRRPEELAKGRGQAPVQFIAFDLLWLDGEPLLRRPLEERRALLGEVLVETRVLRLSQAVRGSGRAFFEQVSGLGLEGLVAKRAASTYRPGARSPDWRKVKALRRQDCAIVGWSPGKGGRAATLGSLLLAVWDPEVEALRYAGNVGTGFTDTLLRELLGELVAREVPKPPLEGAPRLPGARWVRPELVCEVEFLAWTDDRRLRASSFKGIRPDKRPEDCVPEVEGWS